MHVRLLTPDDAVPFRTLRLEGLRESPAAFGASHAGESADPIATIDSPA